MAASESALGALHAAVAIYMKTQLEAVDENGDPVHISAAEVSNILKFLKDNQITCAPADDNEVGELTDALNKRAAGKAKLSVVPKPDKSDLEAALDDMGHRIGVG